MRIDLIWIEDAAGEPPAWPCGRVWAAGASPAAVATAVAALLAQEPAPLCLFWGASCGAPDAAGAQRLAQTPGDVWHAGLRLGTAGRPALIDFVAPTWPLNRDPDPDLTATSWRLSLRACLVRTQVLQRLGGPAPQGDTLAGAALELGRRWIGYGALCTHAPALAPDTAVAEADPTLADAFWFVRARHGRLWAAWALWRALANGYPRRATLRAFGQAARRARPATPVPLRTAEEVGSGMAGENTAVSVLIPTLERYPTLFDLLEQLRAQSAPPLEIIVVDQTPPERRQADWPAQFPDLPLRVIWRAQAGQCSARNAGLRAARGEAILFLDDDDRIPPDLIATHLACLTAYNVDASCGVAEEAGAGPLPADFTYPRASDVFPTNNTLLRRAALADSGLFDLAYETGSRADGDLGMRLTLSGRRLMLNPAARVLHLHAPRGGLRAHQARAVTRAGSRASLRQRDLLAPTEGYLWSRYFTPRQVHEALLIRTVATLRGSGGRVQRWGRLARMLAWLPDSWRQNQARLRAGQALLAQHPTIPPLEPTATRYALRATRPAPLAPGVPHVIRNQ
jgi:GT2 family glycosyltransferase